MYFKWWRKAAFINSLEERLESVKEHPKLKRKVSLKTCIKLDAYKILKCIMEQKFIPYNLKDSL